MRSSHLSKIRNISVTGQDVEVSTKQKKQSCSKPYNLQFSPEISNCVTVVGNKRAQVQSKA